MQIYVTVFSTKKKESITPVNVRLYVILYKRKMI